MKTKNGAELLNDMDETPPRACFPIQLDSVSDLLRMIISSNPRERGGYIFHGVHEGKQIYGLFNMIGGYYEQRGLPLFLYTTTDETPEHKFIAYQAVGKEKWKFVPGVLDDPKWLTIPLVQFVDLPSIFTPKE